MKSLFSTILLGKDSHPPVPAGCGRIHRIEDDEEIPHQTLRFREMTQAIRLGASSLQSICSHLSYRAPRALVAADCEELAKQGRINVIKKGSVVRYQALDEA